MFKKHIQGVLKMYNYTNKVQIKPFELKRKDGKIVPASFYDNSDIETVSILNIKTLKTHAIN